jgi:hypothetical protein
MHANFWRRLLCAAAMSLGLLACSRPDPEQQLRERIEMLQRHIDSRDAAAVGSVLASDFVGNDGMDRRGAQRLAAGTFLRYRDVGVRIGPLQVEMRGERHAKVRFMAAASGGAGLLPQDAQVYALTTGWRLDDGDWVMTNAQWTPAL